VNTGLILVRKVTNIFKECLEDATSLLVDETRDTLDTSTAGKTTNGWLGDALDVVTKDLPVTLGSSLSETLTVEKDSQSGETMRRHVQVDKPFHLFHVQT